jgi:molybdate/tungstate transport system substrate-binding protein
MSRSLVEEGGARRAAGGSWLGSAVRSLLLGSFLIGIAAAVPAQAQTACAANAQQLVIYHAGSLTAAFAAVEKLFTDETGICVTDVAAGSVDAARRVTAGGEPCDIFASADYRVIDLFLKPSGYADFDLLFGQGSMVLAYTTASKGAGAIVKGSDFAPPGSIPVVADDWYEQLVQPGVLIGGSNPFLDPSGYRSDLIFQLAEDLYRASRTSMTRS